LAWLLRKYYSNKIDQHPTLTLKTKSKFYRRFAYYSFSSRRELQVKKEWQSMRIGEEIIKMLRQKRDKQAAGKAKEREANSLEAGPPPAEESFSTINIVIDNGGRRSGIDRRAFQYATHLPERRFGEDRRIGLDRRAGSERRDVARSTADRRESFVV
jgi:hypothetical protein